MKLEKAIENLTAGREDCGMIPEEEYTQTIDLAIEALKVIKRNRQNHPDIRFSLLPGETEDQARAAQ